MQLSTDTPIGKLLSFFGRRKQEAAHPGGGAAYEEEAGVSGDGRAAAGEALQEGPPWGMGGAGWTKEGENPFLLQRHEFHNRFYDLARAKRNWQLVAFASLGLLFLVTLAYVFMASTSRITPYVVEVDQLGVARAFGPAERLPLSDHEKIVTAELSEFITNARRVVADAGAQREAILDAYAFADKSAQAFLNNYYSQEENDPRLLAQKVRRTIHIESILKIPDSDSYRVKWTERERGQSSSDVIRTSWEAILAVNEVPPETEEGVLANPLGIYVYDINWGKINQLRE